MKTKFYAFFMFILVALSAVAAWSVELTADGNGGFYVNMPASGTENLVIPDDVNSFKLYDDGGKNGAYSKETYGYLQMTAAAGSSLRVSGNMTACTYGDALTIFDGNSLAERLLDRFPVSVEGEVTSVGTIASTGETMTVLFEALSNCEDSYEGLNLTVEILRSHAIAVTQVLGGSVVANESSAKSGTTVSLTATPDEGYVLDGIVAYSNGTALNVNYIKWSKTASFVMPEGAVSITPVFVPVEDLSVNVPKSGTDSVFIPASVSSVKIYDDGGSSANYSNSANGYLWLIAPDGYVLRLTGSVATENSGADFLTVFDSEFGSLKLLDAFASTSSGVARDVGIFSDGAIVSSGRALTLHFKSDNTVNYAGLDLTVTLESATEPHSVNIAAVDGGYVVAGNSSYAQGSLVTLTANPAPGYVFMGVSVVDEFSNEIAVTNSAADYWYSDGSVTFTMPVTDVSVTPVFSNIATAEEGLRIYMPYDSTAFASIPASVKSFRVRPMLGGTRYGILEMTAPQGKIFQIEGRVYTYSTTAGNVTCKPSVKISDDMLDLFYQWDNDWENVGPLFTTHNYLKVMLSSSCSAEDLDLLVSVVDPTATYQVEVHQADGGEVVADRQTARWGEIVSVNVSSNPGYALANLLVENVNGAISVPVPRWYEESQSTSFEMPVSDITITPVFSNKMTAEEGFFINMPQTGVVEAKIPAGMTSFKVYDDGGAESYYSSNADGYLKLVAPEGFIMKVSGMARLMSSEEDYLTIYDGIADPSTPKLLDQKRGSFDIESAVSSGNVVTLYFHSDAQYQIEGLDLTVALYEATQHAVSIESVNGGVVTSDVDMATREKIVRLTATPTAGYVLAGINVVDADGNPVQVTGGLWYSNNEASFVMPVTDVTVTPVFTNDLSNLSVNIPAYGTLEGTIPSGVTTFRVYDDGGRDGNYSDYASGSLHLAVPEGKLLQLSGSVAASDVATLIIADNSNTLNEWLYGNADGSAFDVEQTTCLGDTVRLIFESSGSPVYSGVDLEVNLISALVPHSVTVEEHSEGGTVAADYSEAMSGVVVTLTPTPDERFVMTGVSVKDAAGADVSVSYSLSKDFFGYNSASFVMPFSAVSVTPEFKTDLTVDDNMRVWLSTSGTKTVSVPLGVRSFKVMDNSSYSSRTTGSLKLVAPEGFLMRISGTVGMNRDFKIYDGDTDAPKLYSQNAGSYSTTRYIGAKTSSGNIMTIYSDYDKNGSQSQVDLTVQLVDKQRLFSISVNNAVGGALQSVEGALEEAEVTLKATPSEGYVLAGVSVVDENENEISVTGGTWLSDNTASFIMPYANVTVTPVFTNDLANLSISMPELGSVVGTIPAGVTSFKVYDDGGESGVYSSSTESSSLELSAPNARGLLISGSVITAPDDTLYIDNGAVEKGYAHTSTANAEIIPNMASSTVKFTHKKAYGGADGFDLTVSVINSLDEYAVNASTVDGGSVSSSVSAATAGTIVTLTANPVNGYLLSSVVVKDTEGNDVAVANDEISKHGFLGLHSASFIMPNSDVNVTPVFSNGYTVDDLYINMPVSGTLSVPLHAGAASFKVYDDGGVNAPYSYSADGNLEFIASEGNVLQVTGSVTTYAATDALTIYDGRVGSPTLLKAFGSTSSGVARDIGTFVSTGNMLTMNFKTNSHSRYAGLNLVVTQVASGDMHQVSLIQNEGGVLTADKEEALVGNVVTVTATPNTGFAANLDIRGCENREVDSYGDFNTISFVMPNCDVTVTPTYVEGTPFVNIPAFGTKKVSVPAGVTSFKVYDDGGKDADYTANPDGYLELTAPEGSALIVMGSLNTYRYFAGLSVYDGADTTKKLLDNAYSRYEDKPLTIAGVKSSGNALTFYFGKRSGGSTATAAGVDINVFVVDPSIRHTVTVSAAEGGSVVSDVQDALPGDTVSLVATPQDNLHSLKSISVVGSDGSVIPVIGGTWSRNNQAKFVMPGVNVEVIPVFTEDVPFVNMPFTGTDTVFVSATTSSFRVYDDGGADGNYRTGADGTIVLVAPEAYALRVSGSVITKYYNDELSLYDETMTYASAIRSASNGVANEFGPYTSESNVMSIKFRTYSGGTYDGLDILVELVDVAQEFAVTVNEPVDAAQGSMVSSVASAVKGDKVTLTATPAQGFALLRVDVEPNTVRVAERTSTFDNTVAFDMPAYAVSATPVFTDNLTAEGGLFVNLPITGTKQIQIPQGVETFKVYDDGGKNGIYSMDANGAVELVAPEGYLLQIVGTTTTTGYGGDYLTIFDGDENSTPLVQRFYGSHGAVTTLEKMVSSSNVMTIKFTSSNYSTRYAGLDLTVTLLSLSEVHSITVHNEYDEGTIVASSDEAECNTVVTLTANTADGYLVRGLGVRESDGTIVPTDRTSSFDKVISFVMPCADVDVNADYTDNLSADGGLFANIPLTGEKVVNIPVGVSSFNVYDDGGLEYEYSNNADGSLVLKAPDGYLMQVTGDASVWSDTLTIYDGTAESNVLLEQKDFGSVGTLVSSGNMLTVRFASNGSITYDGIFLTVALFNVNDEHLVSVPEASDEGSVVSDVNSASYGATVSLTATPAEGYFLKKINVVTQDKTIVLEGGTSLDDASMLMGTSVVRSFDMPYFDVSVEPEFSNVLTAAEGLHVNLPTTGTKNIVIPTGVKSFKVYDDGGLNGNYTANTDGVLKLTAPEGRLLKVSGNMNASTFYTLSVYEEISGEKNALTYCRNSSAGTSTTCEGATSAGNTISLEFGSAKTGGETYSGLNLTVEVLSEHSIGIAAVDGGAVIANKLSSLVGDTILLTPQLENGHYFEGVSVVDKNGEPVTVKYAYSADGLSYTSARFAMPDEDVTVTPMFMDHLPVVVEMNIPQTGSQMVNVSTSADWYKIYDDGGKNENYSNYDNGTLVLTAPEGYRLQVSGILSIYNSSDQFTVYDGSTNASMLFSRRSSFKNYNLDPLTSSGNVMTLNFYSNGSTNAAGLDLKVTLVPPTSYPVNVNVVENGSLKYAAEPKPSGAVVSLSFTPDEGYFLGGVKIEDADGNPIEAVIGTDVTGSTVRFTMPDKAVTVTPLFTSPTVVSYDENGCLNNGTYFHLECDETNSTCTLSQKLVNAPLTNVDFRCWDFGTAWNGAYTLKLASDLDFGGFNETTGECTVKTFAPLTFTDMNARFEGQGHTVKNFCYVDNTGVSTTGAFGFVNGGSGVRDVTFDNAHVVVNNASGSVVGVVAGEVNQESENSVMFENVHVTNSYVAGSQVGGIVGKVEASYSFVTFERTSFEGEVVLANTAAQGDLDMGPLFGVVNARQLEMLGNATKGNIVSGDAAGAHVGYLGGSFGATSASIIGNYHYGSDNVETGFGNYSATEWRTGSENNWANVRFFANVRNGNTVNNLGADGEIGINAYWLSVGNSDMPDVFVDMFPADLSGETFVHAGNGIASDEDMQRPLFAALLNYALESNRYSAVWLQTGNDPDGMPVFAGATEKPNHLLILDFSAYYFDLDATPAPSLGLQTIASRVQVRENEGVYTFDANYDPNIKADKVGLLGYTDANGMANTEFIEAAQNALAEWNNRGYASQLTVTSMLNLMNPQSSGQQVRLEAATVFTESMNIRAATNEYHHYNVVYQYCESGDPSNCQELGATGKTFLFTAPIVTGVDFGDNANTTLIPYAIDVVDADTKTELAWSASFLDAENQPVGQSTSLVSTYISFGDVLGNSPSTDIATIVVSFMEDADAPIPTVMVNNPSNAAFNFAVYAENVAGENVTYPETRAVTSDESDFEIPLGKSFAVSDFSQNKVGYVYDNTYTVSFMLTNPQNEGVDCDELITDEPIMTDNRFFAYKDEFAVPQGCHTTTWTVSDLQEGEEVSLKEIELAMYGFAGAQPSFSVAPNFNAIDYNIVLDTAAWKEIMSSWSGSDIHIVSFEIYVPKSFHAPSLYNLETEKNLPEFHAVTQKYEEQTNRGVEFTSLWTTLGDYKNCEVGIDGCASANDASSVLSEGLINRASVDASGDYPTFTLYPVWTGASTDRSFIFVDCDAEGNTSCYEAPFTLKLSQTFTVGGQTYTIDHFPEYSYLNANTIPLPTGFGGEYEFKVDFLPKPGHRVNFDNMVFEDAREHMNAYLEYNPTAKTLYLNDRGASDYFTIHVKSNSYSILHYNVVFGRPAENSGLFVVNKNIGDEEEPQFVMAWNDDLTGVTAENANAPILFNASGCRVGWKVKGREIASRQNWDKITDAMLYMVPTEDQQTAINMLEPDVNNPLCDPADGDVGPVFTQTMQFDEGEGHGDIVFLQKVGDNAPTYVRHEFSEENELLVPAYRDEDEIETGAMFVVTAIPEPGYRLKELSYDYSANGNNMKVVVQDSETVNIVQDLTWHAKFVANGNVYVAYDLSLGAEDSSKVWIPTDAVVKDSMLLSSENATVEMWKPYRTDKCFAGWSNKPAETLGDDDPIFTSVNSTNLGLFSIDSLAPTQLYAVWKDYGEECARTDVSMIAGTRYYNEENVAEDLFDDTLIVTQSFAGAVFTHKAWDWEINNANNANSVSRVMQFAVNPAGYDMTFALRNAMGYSYEVSVFAMNNALPEYVSNGTTIAASDVPVTYYAGYEPAEPFKLVLSANGGGAPVFYGENWISSISVVAGGNLPQTGPFRMDACFNGWSFDPEAPGNYNYNQFALKNQQTLDNSLMQQRELRLAAGLNADTLYVVWSEGSCYENTLTLSIEESIRKLVTIELYQIADGVEYKVLEIGENPVTIPSGVYRKALEHTAYDGDNIYFSRAKISLKPGVQLAETSSLGYVNLSDADATLHEFMAGGTIFDDNVEFRVQGLIRNSFNVVYHENASGANVFYGENWKAEDAVPTEGGLSKSLFRADACLVGWSFGDSGNDFVYDVADADFITEYMTRVATENSVDLYAVWAENSSVACLVPTENVVVSLSESVAGKATVRLQQNVGDELKTVATVSGPIEVPKTVDGEAIKFKGIRVAAMNGYELVEGSNPSYKIGESEAVEVTGDTPEWSFTEASELSADIQRIDYVVTFNTNAGKENVFYPDDWSQTITYNIEDNVETALPVAYRTDKCLVGWGFNKDATRSESVQNFDEHFIEAMDAADVVSPVTVYAVWNECSQVLYTVTLNDVDEGTLVLSRGGKTYDVPATGFQVPDAGFEFAVSFIPNLGYGLQDDATFNVVDETGAILEVLTDNALVVNGDKIVDAPVTLVENAFAFDVNAGDAVLFYGDDWVNSAMFSLDAANTNFPVGVYRVDSCLKGWALNTDAERSYKKFDEEFLADVEATKNAGLPVNKLYAVWGECETEQVIASVTHDNGATGSFSLTREVSNIAMTYEFTDGVLEVPVPAEGALVFDVSFTAGSGYDYDAAEGITVTYADGSAGGLADDGLVVSGDLALNAAVTSVAYEFAIDMNAGNADLFYVGEPVTSLELHVTDNAAAKTFPANAFRRDACLDGFAFTDDATVGYKQLDAAFIEAYDGITGTKPTTLYAVWNTRCDQKLLTVTLADSTKGSLVLSQGERHFNVGSGFTVPAVTGGLEFVAEFSSDFGYTYDPLRGVELYNVLNVLTGTSDENGIVNIAEDVSVKAAGIVVNEYSISYLLNAGDATVYYGNSWRAGDYQSEFTRENVGDFPMDLYRTDSCLLGWTLSEDADATIFKAFSRDLLVEGDNGVGVVYAKWGACLTENNVTVSQVSSAAGTMVLTQTDANGDRLVEIRLDSNTVTLPKGNGDVSFNVSFEVGEGYSLVQDGYFYTVDTRGNNLAALANNKVTLTGNTVLRAPILSDTYAITFNTNAGDANVFYGTGWVSEGQFSMEMDETARTFPTEAYRVGYTLVGWSLEPKADGENLVAKADGGYEGVYNLYDEEFSTELKAAGSETVTLYAVWASANAQQIYHVTLADASAGYITARQSVGSTHASFEIGVDGLDVPAVTGGLTFSLEATLNPGYFEDGDALYLVNSDNSRIDSIAGKVLVVNSNKIIEIPVQTDGVQFVFSVNTDARVFYEDGWESTGYFALNGDTAFPTGVLRTEGKLLGWALSRTSTKYYTAYNGKFVEDLNNYKSLGLPTSTLYAVWGEYGVFDNVNVKSNSDKNGSFFITQVVDGVETEPIEVNAAGIQIPYSEKGISFNVKFETKPGYYINAEQAISGVDELQGTTIGQAENGGTLVFKSTRDVSLNASVDANRFKFAYNVNGGDANVFYATDWVSSGDKSLNDTSLVFPTNIYRSDACLEGWSMDSTAETGSTLLTSEFIETLDRTQNVNTLYAVWKECEVETYLVSFANTNVGTLMLTQDVEDSMVTFNVAEEGLEVPVVPGGLKFRAAYTLKPGFSGNTDSLYVVDDLNGLLMTLADNSLTVDEDITLAIPNQGQAFTLVFDVNRGGKLFYGADWVERGTFELSDKRTSIPLPAYVYTSDACMVGWALSKSDTVMYQKFSGDLISALQDIKSKDSTYTMYAVWGKGSDCDRAYDRISLKSKNGTVTLAEAPRGEEKEFIVHEFMDDGTMIVPRTMNGNNIRVFSVPDSSFMLDSLVMTREGSEDERQVFYEGDALVFNLDGVKFEAFFGKSNRTEVAFVNPTLIKIGNAVRFEFGTSLFEITRKVSASVLLETEDGEVVEERTFADSIVPPYNGSWDKFPLAAGNYVLKVTIGDERETDVFDTTFEVTAEIAAVSEKSWQMISIGNLDKEAMVWDDDPTFYWWDETSASGDYWQYKEYNPKDEIVPTRGYWYTSREGRPLVLKSDVEEKVADKVEWKLENVNSGWNLVANPYGFALNLYGDRPADNVEATEKSNVTFWRWDPVAATYREAVIVKPYEAVWVQTDAPTDWILPVVPEFVNIDSLEELENMLANDSADTLLKSLNKAQRLTKANNTNEWRIQAILSDANGHKDIWNVLGASSRPFSTEEPPEGMGDHVTLSVLEGNRWLAKSVKAPSDELEWTIRLSANSERYGNLSFKGIEDLNALGLKVFVTVDGKTTEMHEGENLKVALRSSASKATVRVAKNAKVVADLHIDGLRSVQAGNSLNVSFEASDDLAGTRTIVEVLNMDGKVVSSRRATTLAGTNALALDAPRGGMYMLRVRAGSQMKAGRILVR